MPCFPPAELENVKKILVCQLRQIGDVLLATPAIELLHKRFPAAEIHMFTEKKCLPMLENNPHLTKVWAVDKKELASLPKELAFYWRVARSKYDLIVDFQQLPRCRWVVGFSGAPFRVTYSPPWYTRWLYNCWRPMQEGCYAAEKKANVLRGIGITWQGQRPRLYLTTAERSAAKAILNESGFDVAADPALKLITLDPTHRRQTRLWPATHYARLIDLSFEQNPELRFLPLYGPGEEKDIENLVALVRHKQALLLTPRMLKLREAAACQEVAALHLGNCSAPRHMATAVGTPTLTILGATDKYWDYPSPLHRNISLGAPCQPCNSNVCDKNFYCLNELKPENVLPVLQEMLQQGRGDTKGG